MNPTVSRLALAVGILGIGAIIGAVVSGMLVARAYGTMLFDLETRYVRVVYCRQPPKDAEPVLRQHFQSLEAAPVEAGRVERERLYGMAALVLTTARIQGRPAGPADWQSAVVQCKKTSYADCSVVALERLVNAQCPGQGKER